MTATVTITDPATMKITDPDWTIEANTKLWATDEGLLSGQCDHLAKTVARRLIRQTPQRMPGWTFWNGVFSGPSATEDALRRVLDLWFDAWNDVSNDVTEILDEAA